MPETTMICTMKGYIQPFERRLALMELESLARVTLFARAKPRGSTFELSNCHRAVPRYPGGSSDLLGDRWPRGGLWPLKMAGAP